MRVTCDAEPGGRKREAEEEEEIVEAVAGERELIEVGPVGPTRPDYN
jgi:hypothetical protein